MKEMLGGIIRSFLTSLYEGWVFMVMWGWFVAPTFRISSLPYAGGVGIFLILDWVTLHVRTSDLIPTEEYQKLPKDKQKVLSWGLSVGILFIASSVLAMGAVIHYFFK